MCLMSQAAINIIPLPNKVEELKDNQFELTAETAIRYDTEEYSEKLKLQYIRKLQLFSDLLE